MAQAVFMIGFVSLFFLNCVPFNVACLPGIFVFLAQQLKKNHFLFHLFSGKCAWSLPNEVLIANLLTYLCKKKNKFAPITTS